VKPSQAEASDGKQYIEKVAGAKGVNVEQWKKRAYESA
jgi:hypothetical protein